MICGWILPLKFVFISICIYLRVKYVQHWSCPDAPVPHIYSPPLHPPISSYDALLSLLLDSLHFSLHRKLTENNVRDKQGMTCNKDVHWDVADCGQHLNFSGTLAFAVDWHIAAVFINLLLSLLSQEPANMSNPKLPLASMPLQWGHFVSILSGTVTHQDHAGHMRV